MTYSAQLTGIEKVDAAFTEVYRVIGLLENEIKKKQDKKEFKALINELVSDGTLPGMKYWRKSEDENGNWTLEVDTNLGVGAANWQTFLSYPPSLG